MSREMLGHCSIAWYEMRISITNVTFSLSLESEVGNAWNFSFPELKFMVATSRNYVNYESPKNDSSFVLNHFTMKESHAFPQSGSWALSKTCLHFIHVLAQQNESIKHLPFCLCGLSIAYVQLALFTSLELKYVLTFEHLLLGLARVVLKKGKTQIFRDGSPMVYSGAVDRIIGRPPPKTGDVVLVADGSEKPIGWGLYNSVSMFCVRLMQLEEESKR
jgi:hypothetical protein